MSCNHVTFRVDCESCKSWGKQEAAALNAHDHYANCEGCEAIRARAHAEGKAEGRVAGLVEAADSLETIVRKHTPAVTKTVDAMLFILERAVADLRRAAGAPLPAGEERPAAEEVKDG